MFLISRLSAVLLPGGKLGLTKLCWSPNLQDTLRTGPPPSHLVQNRHDTLRTGPPPSHLVQNLHDTLRTGKWSPT